MGLTLTTSARLWQAQLKAIANGVVLAGLMSAPAFGQIIPLSTLHNVGVTDYDTLSGLHDLAIRVTDTSNNSFDSTAITLTVDNAAPPVGPLPGSQHLVFDGVNDHVNLGRFDIPGNAMALEAWFNSSDLANCNSRDCRIISKATGVNEQDHYWMLSTVASGGSTALRFRLKVNNETETLISNSLVPENTWVHVAATFDGSTMRIYQNGALVGSKPKRGSLTGSPSTPIWLGDSPVVSRPWQGAIDDVRLWQTARSAADIANSMNFELTGNEPDLLAYYKLNEGGGQTAIDLGPNGYAGVLGSTTGIDPADPTYGIEFPDTEAPTAPTNLIATTLYSTQVQLNWTASTDDRAVTEYVIERDGIEIDTTQTNAYVDNSAVPEASYSYVVYAEDAAGNRSLASNSALATLPAARTLVFNDLLVQDIMPDRVTVTWRTNDTSTSRVEYGFDTNYGQSTTATTAKVVDHSVELTGLAPGTVYHFRAISTNDAGTYDSGGFTFSTTQSAGVLSFEYELIDPSATSPNDPHCKHIDDVDGDGFPDLVVASADGDGIVWYEYPDWTKHQIANGSFSTDMETGDVDGDGDVDFIIPEGPNGGTVVWYENPLPSGDPTDFGWMQHIIGNNRAHDVEVADLDDDGLIEVIARGKGNSGGEVVFWKNNGGFSNWQINRIPTISGEGLSHADINGDGWIDILSTDFWHENPGPSVVTNTWKSHRFTTAFGAVDSAIGAGDFNGDGRLDIVMSNSEPPGTDKISWFEAPTDPTANDWTQHQIDTLSELVHTVRVADFNNDGQDDVVVAEMHQSSNPDEVVVYVNQANGLSWQEMLLSTTGSHNMDIGDIDSDGDIDIFGANWNHSRQDSPGAPVELWRNQLSNTSAGGIDLDAWRRSLIDAQMPWRAIFVEHADINGDDFEDIVAGGWWYANPGNVDGSWTRNAIGAPLNNMATVYDFDGDGDADILGTAGQGSQANNTLVWAENDGTGIFTVYTNIEVQGNGDFLQGVVVDRYDPTGSLQIALSWHKNGGTDLITVPADPVNSTWTLQLISTTTQEEQLSSGDIDLDGDKDLLLGNIWLRNEGAVWTPFTLFTPVGIENLPDRNRLIDISGDGRLDAVVGYETRNRPGRLAWYEQPVDPTTIWIEHSIDDTAIAPMSLDVKDLDFDGDIDVVMGEHLLADPASARLIVYENTDDDGLAWQQHVVYTGDEHHDGAQIVDLDNDGDYDIISVSWGERTVTAYENTTLPLGSR